MRNFFTKYGGIIIGSLYGLGMRELLGIQDNIETHESVTAAQAAALDNMEAGVERWRR